MDIQDAMLFYGNLKGIGQSSRRPSYVKLTEEKEHPFLQGTLHSTSKTKNAYSAAHLSNQSGL